MAGIQFPLTEKGDRSTTAFNKAVYGAVAQSLGMQDLLQAIRSEKDWRHKYSNCLDKLVEGLYSCQDTSKLRAALCAGLEQAKAMDFESEQGTSVPLSQAIAAPRQTLSTVKVQGTGSPKTDFVLRYRGKQLAGQDLESQCTAWAEYGTIEPDGAAAIKQGAKLLGNLRGRTFLVLGAGSELGPVRPLLEAGATVAAVATCRPKRWEELISFARSTAGTLLVPVAGQKTANNDGELAAVAGVDLLADAPAVIEWLVKCGREAQGKVTFGTYLYADGEANVRLTVAGDCAVDAVAKTLGKDKLSVAYLASCSTSTAIPADAAAAQQGLFDNAGFWPKMVGKRKSCPALATDSTRCFLSAFEVLQGPNYALAQVMRQWRAALLHSDGFVVSSPMAPSCRTESVVHNKTMAKILEGMAHWAPLEAFDAETARMAMLAILISDLSEEPPKLSSPMHIVTRKSFHSGIWRCPFEVASLGTTTYILGTICPKNAPN
eukprot:TRINITY_DN16371_c0_g1_i1.p1 TRINITY_DN16371_c0_g1~~TRINITY_DN16371_c0_g1_i1.p1  ORF type:complete len:490 (-),score=88.12 TRINITY_DN16371_c0_g1_i1:404-1873(-)